MRAHNKEQKKFYLYVLVKLAWAWKFVHTWYWAIVKHKVENKQGCSVGLISANRTLKQTDRPGLLFSWDFETPLKI